VSESAETAVRKFLAAWVQSDPDQLAGFFTDDAVYTDGPRGVHRGIDAIRAELATMVTMIPSTSIDIKTLVADSGTVMVERVDNFKIAGKPFGMDIAAAFDVDDHGRIRRWREYYDLKSITDRVEAAGFAVPTT
jgi:limonene-1,2-epoxide hydrolase